MHTDQIIQQLLGDLGEADLQAERGRIKDTLYRGTKEKRWMKLKDKPQHYTLDDSLLDQAATPEPASGKKVTNTKAQKSTRKSQQTTASKRKRQESQHQWRAAYADRSLTTAVTEVMQAHPGQVMTADSIAEELLEPEQALSQQDWSAIKKKIGTVLSKGLSLQQWQRLEGQRGAYTMG
ncbi:MAG: hypothetical protein HC851_16765 [Acaryochloris sp. RU_4_1]|nr:hypothetical protein [Acaryochloris sp. RU_4_1]